MSRWMKRFGGVLLLAVLVFAGCDPGFDNPHIEKSGPVPVTTVAPATTVVTDTVAPTVSASTGAPIPGQSDATLNFYRVSDAQLQAWEGADCCAEHSSPEKPAGQRFTTNEVVCLQPTPAGCAQIARADQGEVRRRRHGYEDHGRDRGRRRSSSDLGIERYARRGCRRPRSERRLPGAGGPGQRVRDPRMGRGRRRARPDLRVPLLHDEGGDARPRVATHGRRDVAGAPGRGRRRRRHRPHRPRSSPPQRRATGLLVSAKKSLPLSSTTTNAGKSRTSIFHTASIPSSS